MVTYTTTDVAALSKSDATAILTAAGLPVTGTVAELRARIVDEEVEKAATPNPTPANPAAAGSHTLADAVKAFASVSLTNGQGAEACPLALYSFVKDATGMPKLVGGTWAEVNGALTISKDKYDAPGESYHGREKSVKFVVAHNQTNAEYRISGGALQAAFKTAGRPESFDNIELTQVITESNGYSKAVVTLA